MAVESNATELRTLPDVTLPNLDGERIARSLPSPRADRALSSSRMQPLPVRPIGGK